MWSVGVWWVEAELDHLQDNKHQRQIPLAQILDAMEHSMPSHQHSPVTPTLALPGMHAALDKLADPHSGQSGNHTFKVVMMKQSLLLCYQGISSGRSKPSPTPCPHPSC